MIIKRLRYDCYGAALAGETMHPQLKMEELGITYQHATPQSMSDLWWFWAPKNTPKILPAYISIAKVDPKEFIGWGISKETADKLINQGDLCF